MIEITATHRLTIDALPNWDVIDVSVGPAGDPIFLYWERPSPCPLDPDEAERIREDGPNRFRVVHYRENGLAVVELPETSQDYSHVQPLPGGDYLLTANWGHEELPNADVYASDGRLLRSWDAGNFVDHLQATSDGRIWAGFGDIGFHGSPLGANGAICFDVHGRILFRYNDRARARGVDGLYDCYAMNVASDSEVWLYYYSCAGSYRLVRLRNRRLDHYVPSLPKHGLGNFAVAENCLLFKGGNYDNYDHFFMVSRDGKQSQDVVIREANGSALEGCKAIGRGSRLYLWKEPTLLVVDASDLMLR